MDDFVSSGSPQMRQIMRDLIKKAFKCAGKIDLDPKTVRVSAISLATALARYARDAFGCQRVVNFIEDRFTALSLGMPDAKKEELNKLQGDLFKELTKSGIRIPSDDPYVQKKCAFLLYHLTLERPFYIKASCGDDPETDLNTIKKGYFNACVSVYIINLMLSDYVVPYEFPVNVELIRNLSLRMLSRSCLEEIMLRNIRPKKAKIISAGVPDKPL